MADSKQFGGWYNNPAQGGKNMRWWGGDAWTTGSDPTGGMGPNWQSMQGSQSTPSTSGAGSSFQLSNTGIPGSEDIVAAQNQQLQSLMSSYKGMQEQAGIPGLQGTVKGYQTEISKVQGLLDQLEGDITSRTKGTMTTEAQRRRIQASEQAPLEQQLGQLGRAMTPALSALSMAESTVKDQLDVYIKAIQFGQSLTMEQMTEASDLAKQEQQFEQQKQMLSLQGLTTETSADRYLPKYPATAPVSTSNIPTYKEGQPMYNSPAGTTVTYNGKQWYSDGMNWFEVRAR